MRRTHRHASFVAVSTVAALTACNLILGIDDKDLGPGRDDAGADAPAHPVDAPTQDTGTTDTGASTACTGAATDPEPCTVVVPPLDGGGNTYPTFQITSDLNVLGGDGGGEIVTGLVHPSYGPSDAAPDAVTETISGLTWIAAPTTTGGTTTEPAAVTRCKAIGNDWRPPTRVELATAQYREELTIDGGPPPPCIQPVFRPETQFGTWTSTFRTETTAYSMTETDKLGCAFVVSSSNAPADARCVKAAPKPATFAIYNKRTPAQVHAVETGLDWERVGVIVTKYNDAVDHCAALAQQGWRLPIAQELYGILDPTKTDGFDDRLFKAPSTGGPPTAIVSQTVLRIVGNERQYETMQLVDDVSASVGATNGVTPSSAPKALLVRCVRTHVP